VTDVTRKQRKFINKSKTSLQFDKKNHEIFSQQNDRFLFIPLFARTAHVIAALVLREILVNVSSVRGKSRQM
jgi:hypothetical protein